MQKNHIQLDVLYKQNKKRIQSIEQFPRKWVDFKPKFHTNKPHTNSDAINSRKPQQTKHTIHNPHKIMFSSQHLIKSKTENITHIYKTFLPLE